MRSAFHSGEAEGGGRSDLNAKLEEMNSQEGDLEEDQRWDEQPG